MKTIKQKLLHSKLSVIAVLFFALILLVTGGFATRKASAETQATFSEDNFVMCEGAEVRTDGANGIRFVAKLGDAVPTETNYPNLKYNVMIVPKAYITYYEVTGDWYTALKAEMDADENLTNKTIITMQTTPFYSTEVVEGEEGWYIRGTLSNVKYDNINVEWFGMAYITYDGTETDEATGEPKTEYLYAQIPETDANVRSLVYCASGYLNIYDYSAPEKAAEKEVLTNFVAQGINNAVGNVSEENKNDNTYLNAGVAAIEQSASEQVNLLPEKTQTWTTGVPAGVKLHVIYNAEDSAYASVSDAGIITGVAGDNNAATTRNVTMKALGVTYTRPVHVYKVTATASAETTNIFSKGGLIGDTEFVNSATVVGTTQVDGENVEVTLAWNTTDGAIATVADDAVTAVGQSAYFADKTVGVFFSFEFAGETLTSDVCEITVSFPIAYKTAPKAYGDLMQNVFNSNSSALVATMEDVKTIEGFDGNVTNFFSEDLSKDLLSDGKTNANVYGTQEAGEKNFVVISDNGYGYTVKATVVNYAISNVDQLKYFRANTYMANSTNSKKNDKTNNPSYGMYVIVDKYIDYDGAVYSKPDGSTRKDDNGYVWQGTFDGRGNVIDNLSIERGFFSKVGAYATVKNIAFTNITSNYNYQFGVIGNEVYGKIDNCFVQGMLQTKNPSTSSPITTKYRTGIFNAAYNNATITNCIAVIEYETVVADRHFIIGRNLASSTVTVANCYGISSNETKVVGTSTDNGYATANEFREKVASLPSGYNSYWTYTESGLSFGNNQVLTFTTAEQE